MGDEGVKVDAAQFGQRLRKLYAHWQGKQDELWAGARALSVAVGGSTEDLRYLKSLTLHLWLFGYELPDTVMVFTPKEIHVLASQKKVDVLQPLSETASAQGVSLVMHVKPKSEDGSAQVKQMIETIKASEDNKDGITVGTLPKDKHHGKLFEMYNSVMGESGLNLVDVSGGFADLFSVKETPEILNHKKAAMLASRVLKDFFVQKVESIIDDDKSVKHSKLAEQVEQVILDPGKIQVKLKPENCDIAYPPLIQSGGKYDLKVSAGSDDQPLHAGAIVASLGARYSFYCANISRTYIINPTQKQTDEYNTLIAAQDAAIAALKDGASPNAVSDAVAQVFKDKGQGHLLEKLSKNMGHGLGIEFKESNSSLSMKQDESNRVIRTGQVYNVSLALTGLEDPNAKDPKSKVYAFQVADTVVVPEKDKAPDVATHSVPKTLDKVSYMLNDNEGEEDGGAGGADGNLEGEPLASRKALRSEDPNYKSAEVLRRERQEDLVKAKNQETLNRLTAAKDGGGPEASTSGRKVSEVVSYHKLADFPSSKDLVITVHKERESVLLPIYGVLVPFHVTTIKGVSHTPDGDHAHIRVTFNFSGAYEPYQRYAPNAVFLKELSFRSQDVKHAAKVVQDIKMMRSAVVLRDKERAERATLVAQEKLIQGKRVYKIPDLWMRPAIGGKGRKIPGTLEAHANGFRYVNPRHSGEPVHVMYRNIRHAFFQPAESEMITLLHFNLINPIMLGNKKTKDVQFYAETMDVVQTLDGGRRNMYDPDEIEEEQRERDRRNKINAEFNNFVKRVQELWERDYNELQLEFDIPFRELGFHGVPQKSTSFIMPTVNCLVELTEMPFTVVSLSDVEVINLERVGFNLKNFDMAIVFKDFNRDVLRIDAIPSKSLDTIKDWLNSVNIKYYESKLNLAWKPILKSIQEDPEGFVENGGWEFLNMDKSEEGVDEDGSDASEGYQPSESAEEEEDASEEGDDDDDSDASVVDSEDDDGDEDEEEEGKTWEELEQEAENDDQEFEEEDENPKKRKGGGGGGGAAKKRK